MAIIGDTNIYPPVISNFAPAFVVGSEPCRVYFSISAYNSIEFLKGNCDVHISVTRQDSNLCALNRTTYPSEIKIISGGSIFTDESRTSDDKYYIEINSADIEGGFQVGIIYKVQLRFSEVKYGNYTGIQSINTFLANNLKAFSEWSQVAIVRGITQPSVTIHGGSNGVLSPMSNTWYSDTLEVVGTFTGDDSDPLAKYYLTLLDTKENIVEESGALYPPYQSSVDQINYTFKRALLDGENYILVVKCITENLYAFETQYPLNILINSIEQLDAYVEADEDSENGRIGILIKTNSISPFAGRITIRRTSSLSDFQLWEDVHTVGLRLDKLQYTWYDYTVESGVWYKYCIQKRNVNQDRGIVTMLNKTVRVDFEHVFLVADQTQIKIKFDPNVSSYQRVVKEQKIETLGNKYPVIKRNANTNYKSFPLSGTISSLAEGDKISEMSRVGLYSSLMTSPTAVSDKESPAVFTSREKIYAEDVLDLYDEYNENNRIDIYNDRQYERDFRTLIEDFLYKHNVKLFKSGTEGNVLVKLMNINFTPKNELGRIIYSFSCQCEEVNDFTIANCDEYNVQLVDIGDTDEILSYELGYLGQWKNTIPADTEFVHLDPVQGSYSILEQYYNKFQQDKYILSVPYLSFLRIEMEDPPYLIYEQDGVPVPYEESIGGKSATTAAAAYLGYIVYINNKTIVIPSDGIYEIKNGDAQISSLRFEKDTNAEVRYYAVVAQSEDTSQILALTSYNEFVGQEWGGFLPGESLYSKLWNKSYSDHPGDYYQALVGIYGARIEAEPNTIAWVKEAGEAKADRHIIGPTSSLDFYDNNSEITDVYFTGRHFEEATDAETRRDILPDNKYYIDDSKQYEDFDLISKPINHYVYYLDPVTYVLDALDNSGGNGDFSYDAATNTPKLATLLSAKGVPMYYVQDGTKQIAIIDEDDVIDLQNHLEGLGYKVYKTPSIIPDELTAIKDATGVTASEIGKDFNFVLDNLENRKKLIAFETLINSGRYGTDITLAIKEQIWNDLKYPEKGYYIYHNGEFYVFDIETGDMVSPVPASIDYICETMRGYYRQ